MGLKDFFSKKKHLEFSAIQLAAINKIGGAMATADGIADNRESAFMAIESNRFGVSSDDLKAILLVASEMPTSDALDIINKMNSEQKKYVTAYLGTLINIDNDIDSKELALWRLLSTLLDLPTMSIAEAEQYIREL